MPFVPDATINVHIMFRDLDNNLRGCSVQYPSGNTLANVQAEVEEDLIPALDALSNAEIYGYSISTGAYQDTVVAPSPASDVERKAVFIFRASNQQIVKLEVPSPDADYVQDDTNVLPASLPVVQAIITAMTVPGVDGLAPSTNTGVALVRREGPVKKIHRGSSKG